jgi:hypothetical protein
MHKIFATLLFALAPASLLAVDGQVLISQSTVIAAGGFPYVISQPGSYKLAGNLVVPANTDAIHIVVSNVTLDLNGFSIATSVPTEIIVTNGILATPATSIAGGPVFITNVTIRNGSIRGFESPVSLGFGTSRGGGSWALEYLTLILGISGASGSLILDSFSRIDHVIAPDYGILLTCPSVVAFSASVSITTVAIYPDMGDGSGCSLTGNATRFWETHILMPLSWNMFVFGLLQQRGRTGDGGRGEIKGGRRKIRGRAMIHDLDGDRRHTGDCTGGSFEFNDVAVLVNPVLCADDSL